MSHKKIYWKTHTNRKWSIWQELRAHKNHITNKCFTWNTGATAINVQINFGYARDNIKVKHWTKMWTKNSIQNEHTREEEIHTHTISSSLSLFTYYNVVLNDISSFSFTILFHIVYSCKLRQILEECCKRYNQARRELDAW